MQTFSKRGDRRRPSLISLTPLIDVVFILLLFFMLAYSLSDEHQITLDAPAASQGQNSIQGAVLVDVRTDGVRYAGRYMPLDVLVKRVQAVVHGHPERRVLVRSGQVVALQDTVRVLDALSAAGISHISMMGNPATAGNGG
ncbi:MAG: biopolymer transporter ExbD [Salinisphaera sp.]|jgi:biopolymer transport protein ExbD|nr:biopolymer transporter ExbD [Salinisphaera sp.]